MTEFQGKVALITGGSRGIGAALAKGFSRAGAIVAVTYQNNKRLAEQCAVDITKNGGKCLIQRADVAKWSDVRKTVKKVVNEFGSIDILVNNAGIWKRGEIGAMTEKEWD